MYDLSMISLSMKFAGIYASELRYGWVTRSRRNLSFAVETKSHIAEFEAFESAALSFVFRRQCPFGFPEAGEV